MKKSIFANAAATTAALLSIVLTLAPAVAGSPHFVSVTASVSGNTLTVDFKEAGLGGEATVSISVTGTALCVNPGGNHPKAVNKTGVATSGTFNVNNGQATGELTATATFQPSCAPPDTIQFTNLKICDSSNNVCQNITV